MAMSTGPNNGFSLIGVVMAVVLLTAAVVVVTRLMAQTSTIGRTSRDIFIAANLGREGLELVRAVRDTNWFLEPSDGRHWTHGLCSNSATGDEFTATRTFTLDAASVRDLDPVGNDAQSELYITNNGEWTHAVTENPTPYQRVISVDCSDKDVSIAVESIIAWTGRNGERSWFVKESLYDWLP